MTSGRGISVFPARFSFDLWSRIIVVAILIFFSTSVSLLPPRTPEPTWSNLDHDAVVVQQYNRDQGSSLVAVSKDRSYRMAQLTKKPIEGTVADWSRSHRAVLFLRNDNRGFSIVNPVKHRMAPWMSVLSGNRTFEQLRFLSSSGTRVLGLITDEHHRQSLEVWNSTGRLIRQWPDRSFGEETLTLGPSRPNHHQLLVDRMGIGAELVTNSGKTLTTVSYPTNVGRCHTTRWTNDTHLMFSCQVSQNKASLFIASIQSHRLREVFTWQSSTAGISNLTGEQVGDNFVAAASINGTLSFKFGANSATAKVIPIFPVGLGGTSCVPKQVLSWFPRGLFLLGQNSEDSLEVYLAKPVVLQGHAVMTAFVVVPHAVSATPFK